MKKEAPVFFENLDAIRGIAFAVIFISHFFNYVGYQYAGSIETTVLKPFIKEGHLGVNLFFVLSGFLITFLLLTEKEKTAKINIGFFYMRRILRIWPVYFLVLGISFFIFPMLTHQFDASIAKQHLPYYIFFLQNFDVIATGFNGIGNDCAGVLWSIAVEEQFYLLWPVLLLFSPKKYYLVIFFLIIAASLVFRFIYASQPAILYFHTFSVMSDLAVGSILAYAAIYKMHVWQQLINCPRYIIIIMYLVFAVLIFYAKDWSQLNTFTMVTERLLLSLFFAFIIGEQCFARHSFLKLGKLRSLSCIGIISYGLYCLHLYSVVLVQKINVMAFSTGFSKPVFFIELLAALALSILVCKLSYTYFEKRILDLKHKFSSAR